MANPIIPDLKFGGLNDATSTVNVADSPALASADSTLLAATPDATAAGADALAEGGAVAADAGDSFFEGVMEFLGDFFG